MDSPETAATGTDSRARKSKTVVFAAIAVGLLATGALAALALAPQVSKPSTGVADVVASCQRQDTSVDTNCVHNAISLLPTDSPEELPGLLLAQVQTHIDMGEDCHNLMHTLGKHLADQAEDLAMNLTSEWEPCGYGFLHGVFESQKVPQDASQAGDRLSELCHIGKLNESERLRGECYHALGHAVSDSQEDTQSAINMCAQAFTDQTSSGSSGRIGCYSGVAMKARDQVLYNVTQGLMVPATVEGFSEAAAICESSTQEFALGCAPGFVQIATQYGPSHIGPFLSWCSKLLGEQAKTCYEQAGIYMGHFQQKFYPLEKAVELCGTAAVEYAGACAISLPQGLVNRGYAPTEAVNQACTAFSAVTSGPLKGQGERLCQEAQQMYRTSGA